MNPDDPTTDDDLLDDDVPADPGADADAGERAQARVFADLIDKMMAGRTPAAVPSEQQGLLEVATAIRATVRPAELAIGRRRSIVESALATAIDRRGGGAPISLTSMPVVPIEAMAARRRASRAPWIVAAITSAVAAAAIVMLVMQRPPAATPTPARPTAPVAKLPFDQRSRPADALVGAISPDRAGDALGRIDAIYADRLSGFRDRTLYGGGSQ